MIKSVLYADVRSKGQISLINGEDCDLKYNVDAHSLHCGNWNQIIHVQPMRGVIPAQGETTIKFVQIKKFVFTFYTNAFVIGRLIKRDKQPSPNHCDNFSLLELLITF